MRLFRANKIYNKRPSIYRHEWTFLEVGGYVFQETPIVRFLWWQYEYRCGPQDGFRLFTFSQKNTEFNA